MQNLTKTREKHKDGYWRWRELWRTSTVCRPSTGFRRYSCGNCKLILVDNVGENIGLVNIVLKCPGCQSYNELPA